MGNIYELYYFYPTCIASGFIYELNYLYPAPSASGKHLLLTLVYTVHPNLSTCFFKFRNIFTISWLIICRNSVVKHKFKPLKSLENTLFSAFYFSKLFIVGSFFASVISLSSSLQMLVKSTFEFFIYFVTLRRFLNFYTSKSCPFFKNTSFYFVACASFISTLHTNIIAHFIQYE